MKKISTIVMISLLCISMFSMFAPKGFAADTSPVASWNFDEGSGSIAHDSSGNGNGGIIYSATWVDGKVGKALELNGIDSFVSIPDSSSLDIAGTQMSVEFWVKFDDPIEGSSPYMKFYDKGDAYNSAMRETGNIRFTFVVAGDSSANLDSSRTSWLAGTWYHIAEVYDGNVMSIYVNGALDNSMPMTGNIASTTYPIALGAYTLGGEYFLLGTMDEFNIYNNARTAEQIQFDYQSAMILLANIVQLTTNPYDDRGAGWSPDSSKIVYSAFADSWYRNIWVMNSDGSNKEQLTFGSVVDDAPAYSLDGTRIVFMRYGLRGIDGSDLMLMNADGTNIQQLTSTGLHRGQPRWSHDGQRLAFYCGGAGTTTNEIHIMNADGTNEVTVVSGTYPVMNPYWSPDDTKLVYTMDDGIWIVNTSPPYQKTRVFQTSLPTMYAVFSPDGKYIMYASGVYGQLQDLYLIDTYGNFIAQLTHDTKFGYIFDWSPDGQYIAFNSISSGNYDVWRARIVTDSGLVGYWQFDEGSASVAHDSSGNGNGGTVFGASWTNGVSSGALQFDGVDDYVGVPSSPSLCVTGNQMSVQLWMKPAVTLDANTPITNILDKGDEYGFQMDQYSSGRIWFFVWLEGAPWQGIQTTTSRWEANSWYLLTGTYDGSSLKVYVNGVLESSRPLSNGLYTSGYPLAIGSYCLGTKNFFNGAMDEVKICNYARTAEQIQSDYSSVSPGPVAYWKFDEGSGNIAYDSSGTNNGIVRGVPSWTTGIVGNALRFDGAQNNYVAMSSQLDVTDAMTVEAWIFPEFDPTNPAEYPQPFGCAGRQIIRKSSCGDDTFFIGFYSGYYFNPANPVPYILAAFFYQGGGGAGLEPVSIPGLISQGQWYHLVATFKRNDYARLYVNGVEKMAVPTEDKPLRVSSRHLTIGQEADTVGGDPLDTPSYPQTWIGKIDEAKIYNYARTAEEIQADAGSFVRAWKDVGSIGLENDRLLIHGLSATGNYRWFFDYLIFKDTGTIWYQPWGELAMLVYPNFQPNYVSTTDFEVNAFTASDKAYLQYSITSGNLKEELTYTIYPGEPYVNVTLSVTNVGSTTENTYAGVQFTTWIAGDHANDYFYIPGHGQGQFNGIGNVNFPDATETWVAMWDENKGEGCGMLSTKGFTPGNMISEDFGIGEGFKLIGDNFDLAPGQTSATYDCYLYFFTGTGWQKTRDFYDTVSGSLFEDDFENYAVGTFPSPGGWELVYDGAGSQYQIVTDAYCNSPIKSLQLLGTNGWSANVQRKFTSDSSLLGYEAYMLAQSNTGPANQVGQVAFWNLQGAPWGKRFAVVQFGEDGYLYTAPIHLGPVYVNMGPYEANRWYHVKVLIDRDAGKYSVWIDHSLKAADIAIPDTYEINALELASGHAEVKVFYDDVRVFESSTPPPSGQKPMAILELDDEVHDIGADVWFYGSKSYDPDGGSITSYIFDFDDQTPNEQVYWPQIGTTHQYSAAGEYWPRMKVVDDEGIESDWSTEVKVTVLPPPQLQYDVTVIAHCNTEGVDVCVSVWLDDSSMYYTTHTYTGLSGPHTLTASKDDTSSHPFKEWRTGSTILSTGLTISIDSGGTYTAYYGSDKRKLTVYSTHDSPSPAQGDNYRDVGSSVTCSVASQVTEGRTVWICAGWSGTGSVNPRSGTGNTVTFIITQDSTITWNWYSDSPPASPHFVDPPYFLAQNVQGSWKASAEDHDNDWVSITFDWGDGNLNTVGPSSSGSTQTGTHSYSHTGMYQVKAMATDTYGATSDWSAPLEVTVISGYNDNPKWGGYMVRSTSQAITSVEGRWYVPTFGTQKHSRNGVWVGIGGYLVPTLLQAGVDAVTDPNTGATNYNAFWEIDPGLPTHHFTPVPPSSTGCWIFAGDGMGASISQSTGGWTITITDYTRGWTVTWSSITWSRPDQTTGEWIFEPGACGSDLPSSFGTIAFGSATVGIGSTVYEMGKVGHVLNTELTRCNVVSSDGNVAVTSTSPIQNFKNFDIYDTGRRPASQSLVPITSLSLHSSADLHVFDSFGNHLGYNSTSGFVDAQIPNATYFEDEQGVQYAFLFDPGVYRIEVIGRGNGDFHLHAQVFSNETVVLDEWINGTTSIGATETHHLYAPLQGTPLVDDTPPSTQLVVGEPKHTTSTQVYVTRDSSFTLKADDGAGSGVASTFYNVWNSTYNSGWLAYSNPFCITSLTNGNYTISYYSIDNVGNREAEHTANVTLFSWTYVFTDSCRNTALKINVQYKLFQFVAPDKDFGVRYDRMMFVKYGIIVICYNDAEIRLTATAVDGYFYYCTALAYDKQTRKSYVLVDRPCGPRCLRLYEPL